MEVRRKSKPSHHVRLSIIVVSDQLNIYGGLPIAGSRMTVVVAKLWPTACRNHFRNNNQTIDITDWTLMITICLSIYVCHRVLVSQMVYFTGLYACLNSKSLNMNSRIMRPELRLR